MSTDLNALLEMVRSATGPDRKLDCRMHWFLLGEKSWATAMPHNESGTWAEQARDIAAPRFTASIDAALALAERVLPGCEYEITNLYHVAMVSLPMNMSTIMDPHTARREDCNIPLAIVEALLLALQSNEANQCLMNL